MSWHTGVFTNKILFISTLSDCEDNNEKFVIISFGYKWSK